MMYLVGQSSSGKVVSLLNEHHITPTTTTAKYTQAPYISPPPDMPRLPSPESAPVAPPVLDTPATTTTTTKPKKKHVCPTCSRPFSTSGHLSRHQRVHTGERNHKCPFPGCETKCSRQDNLQQHYRIHLSPRSRRSSNANTRAAIARAIETRTPPATTPASATSSNSSASPRDPEAPLPVLNALGLQEQQQQQQQQQHASYSSYSSPTTSQQAHYPLGPATLSAAHFSSPQFAPPAPAHSTSYSSSNTNSHHHYHSNGSYYSPYPSPHESSHQLPPSRSSSYHHPSSASSTSSSYTRGPPSPLSPMHSGPMSSGSSSAGPATPSWPSNSPSHTLVMEQGAMEYNVGVTSMGAGVGLGMNSSSAHPAGTTYSGNSYPSSNGNGASYHPPANGYSSSNSGPYNYSNGNNGSYSSSNSYPNSYPPSYSGAYPHGGHAHSGRHSPPPILPPIHQHFPQRSSPPSRGMSPPPLGSATRDIDHKHHRPSASPENRDSEMSSRGITPPPSSASSSYSSSNSAYVQSYVPSSSGASYTYGSVGLATSDARRKTFA